MRTASLRNIALVALLALALTFVLVGCGGSSSSGSSSWSSKQTTELEAALQKTLATQTPAIAAAPVGQKIVTCAVEKVEATYSPGQIGEAKYKTALETIGKSCAEQYKPEVEAAEKQSSESTESGSTGATEAESGATESESSGSTGATEEEK